MLPYMNLYGVSLELLLGDIKTQGYKTKALEKPNFHEN